MIVAKKIDEIPCAAYVVTIGFFDGVHRGHQALLERLKELSNNFHAKTLIISFWPHPKEVLSPNYAVNFLNTQDERKEKLEQLGIDYMLELDFTQELSLQSAQLFLEKQIASAIQIKHLLIGHDHRFGYDQISDLNRYQEIGNSLGFSVSQVSPYFWKNKVVSSSLIRNSLNNGHLEEANNLLNYQYSLKGRVESGNQLGRQIGFPTANITPTINKIVPVVGVYAVKINIKGTIFNGMLNIGYRPTIENNNLRKSIEVNIFDFEEDIYGEEIEVTFISYVREEKNFNNVENLKAQLVLDKSNIIEILS